jgi:hypothetical protein
MKMRKMIFKNITSNRIRIISSFKIKLIINLRILKRNYYL